MGEKQEKVFAVTRWKVGGDHFPIFDKVAKVFDDRKDARAYCKRYNERSRKYHYEYHGALKG